MCLLQELDKLRAENDQLRAALMSSPVQLCNTLVDREIL